MAGRLYIPSENQVSGPWLLGHSNLEKLNDLFKEIDYKLQKALLKTIEGTAKQQGEEEGQTLDLQKRIAKLHRKYSQRIKFAEVTFEDGTTYKADDIEGILNYVDTNPTLAPTELYIRTTHGNQENEFDLIVNTNTGKEEVEFEYRIRCLDEDIQQKIKTSIDKWVRENKSHPALEWWSGVVVYFIYFIGFITILISAANLTETVSKTENYKLELQKQAKKTIEKGVTHSNIDSAIVLILKLQSNYIPANVIAETTEVRNPDAWKVFTISCILFGVSLIRPKTIIGIGKKYKRLQIYRAWINITWGTLILLAGALLSDSFLHFINW
jgi:hypothetical protein